jgi:GH24 family phage-related lysozyme (muramidase)
MRSQMSINGEWRNTADGEGVIFGIVLDNGFAPVINNKGEQVIFKFDDRSGLVPGTNIVIDFDVGFNEPESTPATMLIDTFEKANQLARDEGITYEEALEKIRKPDIPNIEFDDGKKNSKIPVDDQSSMLQFDENSQPQFAGLVKKNKFLNKIMDQEGKPFLKATKAFKDEKFFTLGYGRNNKNIKEGETITLEKAKKNLEEDINIRLVEIQNRIPNFSNFSEELQLALFGEYYRGSVGQSTETIKLINAGKYNEAAIEFLNNKEYKDAKKRNRRGIRKNMEKVSSLLRKEGTI